MGSPTVSQGAEVLARYPTDGQFYEATITAVDAHGPGDKRGVATVVFDGYGNSEQVAIASDLRSLPSLPAGWAKVRVTHETSAALRVPRRNVHGAQRHARAPARGALDYDHDRGSPVGGVGEVELLER
jgi:hypothetical protein